MLQQIQPEAACVNLLTLSQSVIYHIYLLTMVDDKVLCSSGQHTFKGSSAAHLSTLFSSVNEQWNILLIKWFPWRTECGESMTWIESLHWTIDYIHHVKPEHWSLRNTQTQTPHLWFRIYMGVNPYSNHDSEFQNNKLVIIEFRSNKKLQMK